MVDPEGRPAEPPVLDPITEELKSPAGGMGQMTFAEAAEALKHYRPVFFGIAAILILALLLPGPRRVVLDGFSATSDFENAGSQIVTEDELVEDPADTGLVTGDGVEMPEPVPLAGSGGSSFDTGSFDSGPSSVPDTSSDVGSPSSSSDDFRSPSGTFTSPSPTTTAAPRPLRVTESLWASRTAGTPLADEGVPEGALPVGTRLSQDDKRTFVRLSGTATVLTLKLGAPEGQRSPDAAAVQACKITDITWKPGKAVSFEDAPPYSTQDCVPGKAGPDRSWSFDLSTFVDRAGEGGVAIVPGPEPPLDFQLAFAP